MISDSLVPPQPIVSLWLSTFIFGQRRESPRNTIKSHLVIAEQIKHVIYERMLELFVLIISHFQNLQDPFTYLRINTVSGRG